MFGIVSRLTLVDVVRLAEGVVEEVDDGHGQDQDPGHQQPDGDVQQLQAGSEIITLLSTAGNCEARQLEPIVAARPARPPLRD